MILAGIICLTGHTDTMNEYVDHPEPIEVKLNIKINLTKMIVRNTEWLSKIRDKYHGKYDKGNLHSKFFDLVILSRTQSDKYRAIEALHLDNNEGTQLIVVKVYVNKFENINFIEMCLRKSIEINLDESSRAEYTNNWDYAFDFPMKKEIFQLISKSFENSYTNGDNFVLKGSVNDCCSII